MPKVVYNGPTQRADPSTEFWIDGHRLVKDVPADVPDEVASELLEGSDRLKGHKFTAAPDDDADAPADATSAAASPPAGGGSGGAAGSAGGTATTRART